MTQRAIEIIFRNKILFLLPCILGLVGGILTGPLAAKAFYYSRASIWVDRPGDNSGASFVDFNAYLSPAQNQANAMNQLLGTKSFVARIVNNVDGSVEAPDYRLTQIATNTRVYPYGTNILYVENRASDPVLAQSTVQAVVSEYSSLYTAQVQQRAGSAKAFYQDQLNASSKAFDVSNTALKSYLVTNPRLANVDLNNPPSSALQDLEFVRLLASEHGARDNYDRILKRFADSQISATSASGAAANFLILDPPEKPAMPVRPTKRAQMIKPVMGLAAGLFLSAGLFAVRWKLDNRIHFAGDLDFLGSAIPIMTLPTLKARGRRWPKTFVKLGTALQSGFR